MSTFENFPGDTGTVVTGKMSVWFVDKVVIAGFEVMVKLVPLGMMTGRPGDAEEVLAVVENNGVKDAILVSVSSAATATVVLNCCVVLVAEAPGTAVVFTSATTKLLNELKLLGDDVLDNIDVTLLSTVEGSTDLLRDMWTIDDVDKDGDW